MKGNDEREAELYLILNDILHRLLVLGVVAHIVDGFSSDSTQFAFKIIFLLVS